MPTGFKALEIGPTTLGTKLTNGLVEVVIYA